MATKWWLVGTKRKKGVKAHRAVPNANKKCRTCGVKHGKGAHRSHGRGSFKRTH